VLLETVARGGVELAPLPRDEVLEGGPALDTEGSMLFLQAHADPELGDRPVAENADVALLEPQGVADLLGALLLVVREDDHAALPLTQLTQAPGEVIPGQGLGWREGLIRPNGHLLREGDLPVPATPHLTSRQPSGPEDEGRDPLRITHGPRPQLLDGEEQDPLHEVGRGVRVPRCRRP